MIFTPEQARKYIQYQLDKAQRERDLVNMKNNIEIAMQDAEFERQVKIYNIRTSIPGECEAIELSEDYKLAIDKGMKALENIKGLSKCLK